MNLPSLRRNTRFTLVALTAMSVLPTHAQTVNLRLHQLLPPQAVIPAKAIVPWAQKVETEAAGRIKVQMFHAKQPVTGLESLRGMKIRGASRVINNMPVPAVTEALSKDVIDGTTIPWEVAPAVKITERMKSHTTFARKDGLYTQTFAFSMNRAAYNKLPPDLKKVIDNNSGIKAAAMFGRALEAAGTQHWRRTAATVETDWVSEMKGKGIDGTQLVSEARDLATQQAC